MNEHAATTRNITINSTCYQQNKTFQLDIIIFTACTALPPCGR